MVATEVVKACGTGKSGKVQIVQGELMAAASVDLGRWHHGGP